MSAPIIHRAIVIKDLKKESDLKTEHACESKDDNLDFLNQFACAEHISSSKHTHTMIPPIPTTISAQPQYIDETDCETIEETDDDVVIVDSKSDVVTGKRKRSVYIAETSDEEEETEGVTNSKRRKLGSESMTMQPTIDNSTNSNSLSSNSKSTATTSTADIANSTSNLKSKSSTKFKQLSFPIVDLFLCLPRSDLNGSIENG